METSENSYDIQIKKYLSENQHNLADVYAAHKKSLETCQEEINQWNKFIEDYNLLQTKLKSYPDKTSYAEAIPIGSLAYMKGYKIHTNEILVHLGENWFAERSVKDTLAIIDRRKEVCKEQLHCSERTKKIHEGWLEQTQSLARESNLIEIFEEISEEEYEKSKEKHKEMVNRHMALMSDNKSEDLDPKNNSLTSEVKAFEHLLKRLDALEEEERALEGSTTEFDTKSPLGRDEECYPHEDVDSSLMNSLSNCELASDKENDTGMKEKLRRRVSWADQLAEQKLRQDDDNEEEEEERDKRSPMDTVHIKYRTRQQSLPAELISSSWNPEYSTAKDSEVDEKMVDQETAEEEEPEEAESELATPQSPSDLYKMFGPHSDLSIRSQPTKGILKKKGNEFHGEEVEKGVGWLDTDFVSSIANSPDEQKPLTRKLPLSESPREIKNLKPAFSYKVVAHDPEEMELDSPPQAVVAPQDEDDEEPKKISRFKAARLKNEV